MNQVRDVLMFDCRRPLTSLLQRTLLTAGFRPRLMQLATGLELAHWPGASAALFEAEGPRCIPVLRAVQNLRDRRPHVSILAVVSPGDPWELSLREAGCHALLRCVADIEPILGFLFRARNKAQTR